jgi:hypothetical protein
MIPGNVYARPELTGGNPALDGIDGYALTEGDLARVYTDVEINVYFYRLKAISGVLESSPAVISPHTDNAGKRWHLQNGTPYALGFGQKWTDVRTSRVIGTTYTNSSTRVIVVNICATADQYSGFYFRVNGAITDIGVTYANGDYASITGIVPIAATYEALAGVGAFTLYSWSELR